MRCAYSLRFIPVLQPSPVAPLMVMKEPAVEDNPGTLSRLLPGAVHTAGEALVQEAIAMLVCTPTPFFRPPVTLLANGPPNVCAVENLAGASVLSSPCVPTTT